MARKIQLLCKQYFFADIGSVDSCLVSSTGNITDFPIRNVLLFWFCNIQVKGNQ